METDPSSPPPSPPRAFAQGVGLVLQLVGGLLFLSTCFVCMTAGMWDPIVGRTEAVSPETLPSRLESLAADPGKAGLVLLIVTSTVGGLALMVFGLGLQSEKRRAAWAALTAHVLLFLLLLTATILLWIGPASLFARGWATALVFVVAALFVLTIPALCQCIAHPPPDVLHTVPHDYDPKRHL